ncbi:arylalcohol dehydrogenase [Coprinopsis marcescibilis]|uniref:Arylalcohol dehydrogenase n=1 Tax=Coprinopsis marcescibilis TaxID=230819 RepID=A0A5C3L1R0_COPMA|nr:arylalcohol dehydrogenase [Coprinopsis marcescibilis]
MSVFASPPTPATALGRYRKLSPLAGAHVSPLQLGAMSIGDQWEPFGMGSMSKEDSFKLLDAYFDKGGNFIDTANFYQDETSELFIGEWAEKRGIRDQLFIATKYTVNYKPRDEKIAQKVFYAGNSVKTMHISIRESLKKLRTDYVDLFYVHLWDWDTSTEEVMRGLHNLVIQGAWSILDRSFEREIIPMARSEGLALAPWNVLASGKLRTDAEEEARLRSGEKGRTLLSAEWKRNEVERATSLALEKVAKEIGAKSITSVAIAYVMQKAPYVFPIIGGRKVEHLEQNIEALELALTDEHIKALESVTTFDHGFPATMIGLGDGLSQWLAFAGVAERVANAAPIRPSESKTQ